MPGYGVPDDVAGVLPWSWAEERLVGTRNYWLVTASAGGRPHALPVWGVWRTGAGAAFALSCSAASRKARNMAANPHVVVTVDDTVECVSVEGRASPVVDAAERAALVESYVTKYAEPDGRAALADFIGENTLWLVRPERAFGVIERPDEFSERATKWVW
jgi:nitroimidazol reductase NimA-like FMN-containing flavoprotein (pyridoxamine 5'-phosphate oxidase superfamily)